MRVVKPLLVFAAFAGLVAAAALSRDLWLPFIVPGSMPTNAHDEAPTDDHDHDHDHYATAAR